jgi:hypothetical protein
LQAAVLLLLLLLGNKGRLARRAAAAERRHRLSAVQVDHLAQQRAGASACRHLRRLLLPLLHRCSLRLQLLQTQLRGVMQHHPQQPPRHLAQLAAA